MCQPCTPKPWGFQFGCAYADGFHTQRQHDPSAPLHATTSNLNQHPIPKDSMECEHVAPIVAVVQTAAVVAGSTNTACSDAPTLPPTLPTWRGPMTPPAHRLDKLLINSSSSGSLEAMTELDGWDCATALALDGLSHSQLVALLELEASGRYAVRPNYMTEVHGGAMVPKWRQQLVEWMEEVVREFRLSDATLFASVQLLDRLLSCKRVVPAQLQALALTCCVICSKIHDTKFIRMVRVGRVALRAR